MKLAGNKNSGALWAVFFAVPVALTCFVIELLKNGLDGQEGQLLVLFFVLIVWMVIFMKVMKLFSQKKD